MAKKSPCGDLT